MWIIMYLQSIHILSQLMALQVNTPSVATTPIEN